MEVIASTQDPTGTQRWVAQATGVPRNRVVAKSKRMGGGFGGKESRTAMVSEPLPLRRPSVASAPLT
jgi:xanthine dehydrogenase/oxidase